ncbi:unnamed protein product [Polarella glacialis]|uniref:Protein kinase domain-containing protein n=1 Tax=Polarella glacialis TaxID=89957 RepID=A0A813J196_POLGL|nr:unnamed protein product [Polarella glacialis]
MRWLAQIFLGLEHMHLEMDTLLRDLKPENVVLSASGCAKLTDFGFGRFGVESSGCWSFGMPSGSPGYVSPEVLHRESYDSRADLYSFGVLAWVMLTGGVTIGSEPVPPMGRPRYGGDFQAPTPTQHRQQQKSPTTTTTTTTITTTTKLEQTRTAISRLTSTIMISLADA